MPNAPQLPTPKPEDPETFAGYSSAHTSVLCVKDDRELRRPEPMHVDPDALNAELSQRLQSCVLVCELDLDEGMHESLVAAMDILRQRGTTSNRDRLRLYPALVTAYLVAEGTFSFAQGAFWPNLRVAGLDRTVLVDVFEHALHIYPRLERFRSLLESGALKFLAPILAHGGIPKYSLGDFFRVVLHAERRGTGDAPEMIAFWREHPSAFVAVDRPVERFLLHGADISVDFLDRCLDLVRASPANLSELPSDRFGLPAYVCDAFFALGPTERRTNLGIHIGTAALAPRPYVMIDPWDASGPVLVLPSLAGAGRHSVWEITGKETGARYPATLSDRVVPLSPALHWTLELRDEKGVSLRTFAFPGLSRTGALLFDSDDNRLVIDPTRLRNSRVWILRPAGTAGTVRQANGSLLQSVEEAPLPTGRWDGYELGLFDVSAAERLVIGEAATPSPDGGTSRPTFWVRVRGNRIALDANPIPGVTTHDGYPIYDVVPSLRLPGLHTQDMNDAAKGSPWFVRIAVAGREQIFDARALAASRGEVIRKAVPPDRIARVEVTARGPLGMDLRTTFCVVPGLRVELPGRVVLPGLTASDVIAQISVFHSLAEYRVPVRSADDFVSVHVSDAHSGVEHVHVAVPCLRWTLVTADAGRSEMGWQPVQVSSRDIFSSDGTRLIIRTRRAGTPLSIQVRRGNQILQGLEATSAGSEGQWTFDLRRFNDTVRECPEPVLDMVLVIQGSEVAIGSIRAELDVDGMEVHHRFMPGLANVTLKWREGRAVRRRVVRLWSLTTPWMVPVTEPVPDEVRGHLTIARNEDEMPPGRYLAEFGVDDGWTTLRRPHLASDLAVPFRLGSPADEERWLRSQDPVDPFTVLAMAAARGRVIRELEPCEVQLVTPAAVEAMWLMREQRDPTSWVGGIAQLLLSAPREFAQGVETASLEWFATHTAPFLQGVIDVLPQLRRSPLAASPMEDIGTLWDICPALAATMDLPHAGNTFVRSRCEIGMGATLEEALCRQIVPANRGRVPELQRLAALALDDLESLRRACTLVPRRPLDLDTQAAVQFEWLIADRRQSFSAQEWATAYHPLTDDLEQFDETLRQSFRELHAAAHVYSAFPIIRFPEVVYAAALHTVFGTSRAAEAVGGLRELLVVAPGIVTRSIVVAAVHLYHAR